MFWSMCFQPSWNHMTATSKLWPSLYWQFSKMFLCVWSYLAKPARAHPHPRCAWLHGEERPAMDMQPCTWKCWKRVQKKNNILMNNTLTKSQHVHILYITHPYLSIYLSIYLYTHFFHSARRWSKIITRMVEDIHCDKSRVALLCAPRGKRIHPSSTSDIHRIYIVGYPTGMSDASDMLSRHVGCIRLSYRMHPTCKSDK